MNIKCVEMTDFMCHAHLKLDLPRTGVVAITGPNGHGKSSVVEAVATAFWGKTLRGSSPWRPKAKSGYLVVTTYEDLASSRMNKQGKALVWTEKAVVKEFETTTKAQEALEQVVGPFDVWRRAAVFSSADAAHFTLAPDGERKRLLEDVLQLSVFDEGLESCRTDLALLRSTEASLRSTLSMRRQRLESAIREAEQSARILETMPEDGEAPRDDVALLARLWKCAQDDLGEARVKLRQADLAGGEARALAKQLRQALERIRAERCPTCSQEIPIELRQRVQDQVTAAEEKAKSEQAEAKAAWSDVELVVSELEGEAEAIGHRLVRAKEAAASAERIRLARKRAMDGIASANARAAEEQLAVGKEEPEHASTQKSIAELAAVELALGLRGVRANVLGRALGGLEAVANVRLAQMAQGMKVSLKPYTEKKTGGVADAISLDISGAGGGLGYRASSSGERRRVDVALMLALAEVAAGAAGTTPGTLFFDEVADSLDVDGMVDFAEMAQEMAKERCLVIITHSGDLLRLMKPVQHVKL